MAQPLNLTTGIVFLQPNAVLPITGSITLGPGADLTGDSTAVIRLQMTTPASPTPVADNGSGALAAGTYQITVVAVDPNGGLTLYPTAQGIVTAGGTSHINVAYVLPAGAVSMRVYTSAANGATPDRYFTSTSPVTYALTTLAGATVAALPTAASAYKFSVGGSATFNWFGMPIALNTGTATTAVSPLSITQVANNAGVVFPGIKFVMTEGASGTAAGTLLLDLWYGTSGAEATKFSVSKAGLVTAASSFVSSGGNVYTSATLRIGHNGRSVWKSPADGELSAMNFGETAFTTINLGPTTGNTASGSTQFTHLNATIDMSTAIGTGTGTITIANFFPAGTMPIAFSGRVTTILAGAGLTTWKIGPTSSSAAFGTGLLLAQDTLVNGTTYTVSPPSLFFTSAANLVITAAAGVFSTGILKVTATVVKPIAIGS
jgi:hypothetical protein